MMRPMRSAAADTAAPAAADLVTGPPAETEAADLRAERPVFAASVDFARAHGGPLTRRFLDALPPAWPAGAVVVDSTLVWLSPGMTPGDPLWHREPYPREGRGAYVVANGERAVHHVACVFGAPALPELLGGDPPLEALPAVCGPAGWDAAAHRRRDALIEGWLREGRATVVRTALGVAHAYDGATFVRERPAPVEGFRFWIRATLGSARPRADGLRNVTTLLV